MAPFVLRGAATRLFILLCPALTGCAMDAPSTAATAVPEMAAPRPLLPKSLHAALAADLASRARPIRSLSPEDTDFADLEPIGKALGSARVVVLGEVHADANSYLLKTRLVKFFHARHGFTVLAFEAPLFEAWSLEHKLATGCTEDEILGASAFGSVWRNADELRPLARYLLAHRASDRPLRLAGVDPKFDGSADGEVSDSLRFLQELLEAVAGDPLAPAQWQRLHRLCLLGERSEDDVRKSLADAGRLRSAVAGARERLVAKAGARDAAFAETLATCVEPYLRWAFHPLLAVAGSAPGAWTNPRDHAMADNVLALLRGQPDAKVILWTGGFHSARDADQWLDAGQDEAASGPQLWRGMETVAHVLHQELGDGLYALGVGPRAGSHGRGTRERIPEGPPESLENLLDEAGQSMAFLDLRSLPAEHTLHAFRIFHNGIQPRPIASVLPRTLDGILYLRNAESLGSEP